MRSDTCRSEGTGLHTLRGINQTERPWRSNNRRRRLPHGGRPRRSTHPAARGRPVRPGPRRGKRQRRSRQRRRPWGSELSGRLQHAAPPRPVLWSARGQAAPAPRLGPMPWMRATMCKCIPVSISGARIHVRSSMRCTARPTNRIPAPRAGPVPAMIGRDPNWNGSGTSTPAATCPTRGVPIRRRPRDAAATRHRRASDPPQAALPGCGALPTAGPGRTETPSPGGHRGLAHGLLLRVTASRTPRWR